MDDTASDIEQRKTNRLHPLADPSVPKPQLFERSMQVQGHHHDAPPSGIGAELATGQSAASKVILHDRMDFLALATAQTMPSDQIIASHFELIGDNAEQLSLVNSDHHAAVPATRVEFNGEPKKNTPNQESS